MNGVIYVRVSSSSQVDGTSLDDQVRKCTIYCEENNIEVVKVFRDEGQSAKSTDRKDFLSAIQFCGDKKNKVEKFVVYKVDRFARNAEDHFSVRKILVDYGVTLESVTETIGNNPAEKVMESMLAAFAEFDNSVRAKRSTDGMSAKINQGIYPWHPPTGYTPFGSKKRDEKKNAPDPINPDIFPIIQQGLKEYATGGMTKMELNDRFRELGIDNFRKTQIGKNFAYQMLVEKRLRFYAGYLWNPYDELEVKGLHEPMITEDEFNQIMLVLSGKKVNKHERKYQRYNPSFPLRGTVCCHECKCPVTGSRSTNGKGVGYYYYHCEQEKCLRKGKTIQKTVLEDDFSQLLESINLKPAQLKKLKEKVISRWKARHDSISKQTQVLDNKKKKLEQRKERIQQMMEDGIYESEDGKERLKKVKEEILVASIDVNESKLDEIDMGTLLSYTDQFITNLSRQWKDLKNENKPKFQTLVFPAGITYHPENKFGTPVLGYVFEVFEQLSAENPSLVPLPGIEPRS